MTSYLATLVISTNLDLNGKKIKLNGKNTGRTFLIKFHSSCCTLLEVPVTCKGRVMT